jgi:hypothetical protein
MSKSPEKPKNTTSDIGKIKNLQLPTDQVKSMPIKQSTSTQKPKGK